MALVKVDDIEAQIEGVNKGFTDMPLARQIGLMVGLAASIAIAVAIVMWTQEPSYRMLYGNLSDQEILEISTALNQSGIQFEVNQATGAVMVEGSQVHDARMKLAGQGLPKGSGTGYELLDKDQGFGTSQFMETARYHRAIEGELSKSISSLNNVQTARVHLAIPKQSAFVRNRKKASASVMLSLYQGRAMNADQAFSIAHMVASSIPNLEVENVTVVDQNGRMLTRPDSSSEIGKASTQFEYRTKLEDYYIKRIEEIIQPIVGIGKMRAQVVADLDFTVTEQTLESFNPDLPSVRSEQSIEEEILGGSANAGVPGTLTNQPPQAGTTIGEGAQAAGGAQSKNSSRRVVRNYELDRTISHTRHQTGILKRLSAAVVIDNKTSLDEEGAVVSEPLSAEDMAKITSLVKEAIGFNVARGDSVNVINASFTPPPELVQAEEPGLLDQPWVLDFAKQAAGVIVALLFVFLVLRPILRGLVERGNVSTEQALVPVTAEGGVIQEAGAEGGAFENPLLAKPSYEQQVEVARSVAKQEPHRMAHIVKEWVEKDG